MSIVVKNLLKLYGQQKAVNDLSFVANKGEIVGFLGPNGAGKSTTMKMVTGYLKPDGGTAEVSGINVGEHPIEVKKKIGYLPEANPLYFDMYVKEYLAFVAGIHQVNNPRQRIDDVIQLTGLALESKKRIGQLSKGYKQRVGLAAALIHDPEVLILDEPTSGLDPNQIIEIRNVIREQGKNKTVLFSSHILQEVEAICDRVIIINRGVLVANDTLSALHQKGRQDSINVTFKEVVSEEIFGSLKGVSAITRVDQNTWQLVAADAGDVKRQLLELSLRHQLNIVSLVSQGGSLEDIFRSLTKAK